MEMEGFVRATNDAFRVTHEYGQVDVPSVSVHCAASESAQISWYKVSFLYIPYFSWNNRAV